VGVIAMAPNAPPQNSDLTVLTSRMPWICPDTAPACASDALCDSCYGRTLTYARAQARVIGATWAERVARDRTHRGRDWPAGEPKAREIARRLVRALATDPRLVDELGAACEAGASAWWAQRPERYR
jgi:hypothetical protein